MGEGAEEAQTQQVAAVIPRLPAALGGKIGEDGKGQAAHISEEVEKQITGAGNGSHRRKKHADVVDHHGPTGQIFELCGVETTGPIPHGFSGGRAASR